MRIFFITIISVLYTVNLWAQYYEIPSWFINIKPTGGKELFVIGISDPRMENSVAYELAVNRALQMAVLLNNVCVSNTSDYFESGSEEHRAYIVTETYQELARFDASSAIKSFRVVEEEVNENGETLVLVAVNFIDDPSEAEQMNVCAEYFRQDFEISNTRAHESIRSISMSSVIKESINPTTLAYKATNVNGTIVCETIINDSVLPQPGYFYHYYNTLPEDFNITAFQANADLEKGLWYAYLESVMMGMIKISKNRDSKLGTVDDDYLIEYNDEGSDTKQEALSRQVSKNSLFFILQHLGVINNQLYASIRLPSDPAFFIADFVTIDENEVVTPKIHVVSGVKKKFFLWRWLCKNKYRQQK
jgi:hypothetical protein